MNTAARRTTVINEEQILPAVLTLGDDHHLVRRPAENGTAQLNHPQPRALVATASMNEARSTATRAAFPLAKRRNIRNRVVTDPITIREQFRALVAQEDSGFGWLHVSST